MNVKIYLFLFLFLSIFYISTNIFTTNEDSKKVSIEYLENEKIKINNNEIYSEEEKLYYKDLLELEYELNTLDNSDLLRNFTSEQHSERIRKIEELKDKHFGVSGKLKLIESNEQLTTESNLPLECK